MKEENFIISKIKQTIKMNDESAEAYIGAATRALTEVNAKPDRVIVYHDGSIYLDIPLTKGRLICPVGANCDCWKIEIWGKYGDERSKCLFTSDTVRKKVSGA